MSQRPLECSKCCKPLTVNYKEIDGGKTQSFSACSECPIIQQRMHGCKDEEHEIEKSLCCETCKTTLLDIQQGHAVGCSDCYQIFEDVIIRELKNRGAYPEDQSPIFTINDHDSLHVGKTPFDSQDIRLSKRLTNLNEALSEALKIENYEQAAWLRDRIKSLSESSHEQAS